LGTAGVQRGDMKSVAQITPFSEKQKGEEIRKVVTLNRIFVEPGRIAPFVDP
jgi:hypothetical protein